MKNRKISIIGCGNLGLSILNGLLKSSIVNPSNIIVTRRNVETLEYLKECGVKVTNNNIQALEESEIVFIALKPYNILEVLKDLSPFINSKKHILVSLATGISIEQIHSVLQNSIPIYRAMPNTAADVGVSMTCVSHNNIDSNVTDEVVFFFNSIGETVCVEEELMDAVTVLGACGIAYALRFIRAMIQGGIQIGFDVSTASKIVSQTVKGAATLLIENKKHPEFEIDKVTTPKGCTIAGLNEMEHNGFSSALIKGINASFKAIE